MPLTMTYKNKPPGRQEIDILCQNLPVDLPGFFRRAKKFPGKWMELPDINQIVPALRHVSVGFGIRAIGHQKIDTLHGTVSLASDCNSRIGQVKGGYFFR